MKKLAITSALVALFAIPVANAATTITAANAALGTTGFAQQVLLNGAPFASGTIQIGTFNTALDLGSGATDVSDLGALGWTLFASADFNASASYPGIFGALGASGATGTLPESETGPLVGNPIFAIISNGAGELIIWNSGQNFAAEVPGLGGAAVSFLTKDVQLVRGAIVPGGNTGLAGPLAARNGQDAVTFIPEPSAALLGVFGMLGLLRRRRN